MPKNNFELDFAWAREIIILDKILTWVKSFDKKVSISGHLMFILIISYWLRLFFLGKVMTSLPRYFSIQIPYSKMLNFFICQLIFTIFAAHFTTNMLQNKQ